MKFLILALTLASFAGAQTPAAAPATSSSTDPSLVSIPVKLPAMIGGYVQFNQLATPKWNGGVVAIYPVFQSAGIYGSTLTDVFPQRKIDPTTGRSFIALNTSVRQGFHKDLFDTGRISALIGGDVGPSFTGATGSLVTGGAATVTVSLSSSATGTLVYKATSWLDIPISGRMLYVTNVGWNPVLSTGLLFNLKKLPKAK